MRGERGFALIITLIVTALLVALVTQFVNDTYVGTSHSHNFVASQQAGLLAESGAMMGKKLVELELGSNLPGFSHSGYSSLLDKWAQPIPMEDETGKLTVTIEEESGKLNLNTVSYDTDVSQVFYPVAQRLFANLKLSDLLDAAIDWRQAGTQAPRPNGAKSSYYNTLKPSYDVKGGRFDSVEELGLVKGFTPKVLDPLKQYVTVYGATLDTEPETKININTAPKEVLAALDAKMTEDLVNRILDARKTKPIQNFNDIPGIGDIASILQRVAVFRGSVFRIRSEGKVGEITSIVEAVIRLNGSDSTILYWREY